MEGEIANAVEGQQPEQLQSVAALLKLIGTGATAPILMALGPRALRTNALTQRLPTFAPRTVYRYSHLLADLGLIERDATAGVPSNVVQRLSGPGRDLFRILDTYAHGHASPEQPAMNGAGPWAPCELLGEMWELDWIEALSYRGRSAPELTAAAGELSRTQVASRARQLLAWELLFRNERPVSGQGKRYQLSDRGRRGCALILALGRWREQHVAPPGVPGFSTAEVATAIRACLPLLRPPGALEGTLSFGIAGPENPTDRGTSSVSAHVHGGKVRCVKEAPHPDAWAVGTIESWLVAIVGGEPGGLRTGGDQALLEAALSQLQALL